VARGTKSRPSLMSTIDRIDRFTQRVIGKTIHSAADLAINGAPPAHRTAKQRNGNGEHFIASPGACWTDA
jgi:hypothetical protein